MSLYPSDPLQVNVLGREYRVTRRSLGPGPLRVGSRSFWLEELEIVVRSAWPMAWRPGERGRDPERWDAGDAIER
ncbi:hypothetical protein U7230_14425 [Carboxydochorda subterranea]|uniref:Uncharacterized protein n=1 Tax=Carboxydichorda subterranea TaxID=3109565 RepID=A0ABZ1BYW4_9FIRM|nr:hypothetical protein [Limnochorda sp. L945t]WRP17257.1 hypothetical protein U7230_14425 [Limnochorda sp. L945t]